MKIKIAVVVYVLGLLFGGTAMADEYLKPNWSDLLRTMVRLKGIELQDPLILDEYSIITECALYRAFYADDFKWNKIRTAVLDDSTQKFAQFPIRYHYDTKLQLDRYDFQNMYYRFSSKATLNNINTVVFYEVFGSACGKADIKYLPKAFRVVFDEPVNVPGLPLDPKSSEQLMKTMNTTNNIDRIVYTRFNFKVVYIEPLTRNIQSTSSNEVIYSQASKSERREMRMDAHLDSIGFFQDEEMTKLIYEYKP